MTYAPSKANDGDYGTHWNAGNDSGEAINESDRDNIWWYVDLQDQYSIKYISLHWTLAFANSFIVQVRKDAPTLADAGDDSAWETCLDYSGEQVSAGEEAPNYYGDVTGSKAAFAITPKGRYIRLRAKGANNWGWGVQLQEIRVYGSGYLPIDNTAPVIGEPEYIGTTNDYEGVLFRVTATDDQTDPVVDYRVVDNVGVVHNVTAVDGVITVTDLPTGKVQTLTIYALDAAGNVSDGKTIRIDYVNPIDNLALNKPSYACVSINEGEGKAKANDGDEATDWTSWSHADHSNDWWYVDLGDYYDIRRIEVVWTADRHSTSYSLQYRQNAPADNSGATESEWDTFTEFSGKSGDQSIDITNTQAQFICLRSKAGYVSDQVRIKELRVFGKKYATADNTAPVFTDDACEVIRADEHTLTLSLEATDNIDGAIYEYTIQVENTVNATAQTYIRTTDAESNQVTITDATIINPCYDLTITVTCADHAGNVSLAKVFSHIAPAPNPATNIALNKTTIAGHTEDGNTPTTAYAVDGDSGTKWSGTGATAGENEWFAVDLGTIYDIAKVRILWGTSGGGDNGTYPIDFKLQASIDNNTWYTFRHDTEQTPFNTWLEETIDHTLPARYIRVWVDQHATYAMSISELEVYSKADCYEHSSRPIISLGELKEQHASSVILYCDAFDESTDKENIFYQVQVGDDTPYYIESANIDNGIFTIDELTPYATYTITIRAVTAKDDAHTSVNYKTLTVNLAYSDFYWISNKDGWATLDQYRMLYNGHTYGGYSIAYLTQDVVLDGGYFLYKVSNKAKDEDAMTDGANLFITGHNGESMTLFALDKDHFVSNFDDLYIVGTAVRGHDDKSAQADGKMVNIGNKFFWSGNVDKNGTFQIVPLDHRQGVEDQTPIAEGRIMSDATYEGESRSMTLIFDMETWTYTWEPSNHVIYHVGDKASDPHALGNSMESYAGGTIPDVIEYRMQVRAIDQWFSLALPFEVDSVCVWDDEDVAYYRIYPYYRDGSNYIAWHYIIRTPEIAKGLAISNFQNWNDPTSKNFLPQKNTPYIIQWHDPYFLGKYISFFGAKNQSIPTEFTAGDAPTNENVVNVHTNNCMQTGSVLNAYLLEGDYGYGAWLREEIGTDRTILPFECYILAGTQTTSVYRIIGRDVHPISTDMPNQATAPVIYDHLQVFTPTGVLYSQWTHCTIDQVAQILAQTAPTGIYILHTDKENVKIYINR